MARRARAGGVNKSQAIRDLLKQNPEIRAKDAMAQLAAQGIKIHPNQFYFIKGNMRGRRGRRGRRRKMRRQVETVMATSSGAAARADVLSTINKVLGLAAEVGGMKKLAALVEALAG